MPTAYRFCMSSIQPRPIILVLLLWLAGLGAATQFAKIAVPFAIYQALYPEVGSWIGWLLSIVSIVGIVFGLIAGILVAKIGYVRLLITGLLMGAAMSFWQARLPGFSAMLTSRLIEGVSQLIIVVVAPTLIAQFSTDRYRGAAMALWSTFFGVSFAFMAWVGMPFLREYGLHGLLSAHSAYMVILAACLTIAFRIFDLQLPKSDSDLYLSKRSILKQHITTYKSPYIAAPAIGWLFYTLTFVSLLALIPATLPTDHSAVIVGLLPLISIVVSLVGVSFLLILMPATRIVTIGFSLAAAIVLARLLGLPAGYAWVGLFAVLGLIQGGSFAAIVQLNSSPRDRAMANGAMAQMGNLGNALGTPVLLAILGISGVKGMLYAVCALYVMGGLVHILLSRKRRV